MDKIKNDLKEIIILYNYNIMNSELEIKRKQLLKDLKKERNIKTYNNRRANKIVCDTCCVVVDQYYYDKHCNTKFHKKLVERQNRII